MIHSCAYGILCRPPVSFRVRAAGTIASRLFSAPQDHPAIPHQRGVTITPHPRHQRQPPGFTWAAGCALERTKPSGPPGYHCASPLLTRLPTCTEGPQTPPPHHTTPERSRRGQHDGWAWVSTRASAWAVLRRYGNINPSSIDYACRPRLRSRLTQGGLAWPWNPWSFGARASHPSIATHACILTPTQSTTHSRGSFTSCRTLPYPTSHKD